MTEDTMPNYPVPHIDGTPVIDGTEASYDIDDIESMGLHFEAAENGYELDESEPLSWVNSARVSLNREWDSVTVMISVGDPRGAFAMTVVRKPDGSLMLEVPDPSDSLPHAKLTQIAPGTFRIGN